MWVSWEKKTSKSIYRLNCIKQTSLLWIFIKVGHLPIKIWEDICESVWRKMTVRFKQTTHLSLQVSYGTVAGFQIQWKNELLILKKMQEYAITAQNALKITPVLVSHPRSWTYNKLNIHSPLQVRVPIPRRVTWSGPDQGGRVSIDSQFPYPKLFCFYHSVVGDVWQGCAWADYPIWKVYLWWSGSPYPSMSKIYPVLFFC